jgi:hypothetical protein
VISPIGRFEHVESGRLESRDHPRGSPGTSMRQERSRRKSWRRNELATHPTDAYALLGISGSLTRRVVHRRGGCAGLSPTPNDLMGLEIRSQRCPGLTERNPPSNEAGELPCAHASIRGGVEASCWENGTHDGAGPVSYR